MAKYLIFMFCVKLFCFTARVSTRRQIMSVINVGFRVETRSDIVKLFFKINLGFKSWLTFDLYLTLDLYLGNIDVVSVVK